MADDDDADSGAVALPPGPGRRELVVLMEGQGLTFGDGSGALDQLNAKMGRATLVHDIPTRSPADTLVRVRIPSQGIDIDWEIWEGYVRENTTKFLEDRGINQLWKRQAAKDKPDKRAVYFEFRSWLAPDWIVNGSTQAYAGTYWQLLLLLSASGGRLRQSGSDAGDGGSTDTRAVCCSPQWIRSQFFAWGTNVFGDGFLHGLMLDVAVCTDRISKDKQWGSPGWLHDFYMESDDVWLRGMWVLFDKHVAPQAPRFENWDPELEVLGYVRDVLA